MYKFAAGYLRAHGYEHYEVSSYALKEDVNHSHRSQHNQVYWDANGQWYAFGLGATSFVEGRLTSRPKTFAEYLRWADDQWDVANSAGDSVPRDSETDVSSDLDVLMDVVLKRLRTSEGLALDWVRNRFEARGESYVEAILRGAQLGIELNLAIHEGGTLRLVEPDGFLYSNSIISSIFAELEDLKDA
jgi:oxygen-independent coproporphyrinogen-3 oxidase